MYVTKILEPGTLEQSCYRSDFVGGQRVKLGYLKIVHILNVGRIQVIWVVRGVDLSGCGG